MKNKKSIYVLLPIVIFIWGLLIYQFFSYSDSMPNMPDFKPNLTYNLMKPEEIDTFSINVNYRDPFLGKIYKEPQKKDLSSVKQIKTPSTIIWPEIKYKGIVSDLKNKNKIFLVVINGKNCLMKIGQTHEEVRLKSGNKSKVALEYKKNSNSFFIDD